MERILTRISKLSRLFNYFFAFSGFLCKCDSQTLGSVSTMVMASRELDFIERVAGRKEADAMAASIPESLHGRLSAGLESIPFDRSFRIKYRVRQVRCASVANRKEVGISAFTIALRGAHWEQENWESC